jgi:hypothetical protein
VQPATRAVQKLTPPTNTTYTLITFLPVCKLSHIRRLLLKYLGEEGQNCLVSAAVAISPAYDFHDRTHLFAKYERMGMVKGYVFFTSMCLRVLCEM